MAYGMDDLVREQPTFAGGTGAVTLTGTAVSGFQSFLSGWGASGTGEYRISVGAQWETGFGTLNAGGTSLARTTVYDGSSGAGVAVNFSAGTLDCIGAVPAELCHYLNMLEISIADSATPDIGAVRGSAVTIAGTTAITGFGTSKNRRRFVRFSTARTLTHNATSLILPGGANITTAAGDTCIAISDSSGNWRVWNYVVAALVPGRLRSKIVSFTRDLTTATGTQAVTGVGFKPTAVIFFAAITSTALAGAAGAADSALGTGGSYNYNISGTIFSAATNAITLVGPTAADVQGATVQSYDTDGFTLSWTKTNSAAGTGTIKALCLQ